MPLTKKIFLSDRDDTKFVTVDAVDYDWLMQWRWSYRYNSTGKKIYAVRNTTVKGTPVTLYMHVEIMKRTGAPKPSPKSYMTDHIDCDSTNNRRSNLRWATPRANTRNRIPRA